MALDGIKSFSRLRKTFQTHVNLLQNSPTIARFLQCDGGKLEEAEDFKRVYMYEMYCVIESKYTNSSA